MKNLAKRIVIHGSCITRDVFRIHPEGFNILDYFSRSSISSIVSEPIDVSEDHFSGLNSDFQRRMLLHDFRKDLFSQIEKFEIDNFLIDLIDERFNLLQRNLSIVTKSSELINSNFLKSTDITFQETRRIDYSLEQWKKDCYQYVQRLTRWVPEDKIMIIKGLWAERYLSTSGEIIEFNNSGRFQINLIRKMNALLEDYYAYIISLLPNAVMISFPKALANESHEWGLSPFHYTNEQYDYVYNEIYAFAFLHQR